MKKGLCLLLFLCNNAMASDPGTVAGFVAIGSFMFCVITKNCWQERCCNCLENHWDPLTQKCAEQCERKDLNCTCICKTCVHKTKKLFAQEEPVATQPGALDVNEHLRQYVLVSSKGPNSEGGGSSNDTVIIHRSDSENSLLLRQ